MGLVNYRESGRRSWLPLLVQYETKSVGKYRKKESWEKGFNELQVLQALTGLMAMLKTTSFFLDFCDFYKALHLAFHATFVMEIFVLSAMSHCHWHFSYLSNGRGHQTHHAGNHFALGLH